jgi:glycosyltransferase involved in cell wall biosynthesis
MQLDYATKCGGKRMKRDLSRDSAAAPLVSIIVVAFRDREEVAALIDNISPYRGPDVELVIIDGASDDKTLDLLQSQNEVVDYWLSEPDSGIYDAMNKGIAAAQGEYILHLNAGDRLRVAPLEALRRYAEAKVDVISCSVLIDGEAEFVARTGILSKIANTWHHQGTFYRRTAHLGYDATYRTHGDFDHNQRMLKARFRVECDPTIVADHQSGGASMTNKERLETYRSIRTNFGWCYFALARLFYELLDIRSWIKGKLQTFRAQFS